MASPDSRAALVLNLLRGQGTRGWVPIFQQDLHLARMHGETASASRPPRSRSIVRCC